MIEQFEKLPQPFGTFVMRKLLGNLEFLSDLLDASACLRHFSDFVSHHYKIAFLLFKIFNAAAYMNWSVAWNVGLDGETTRHDGIQDFNPAAHVGEKYAGRF